MVQSTLLLVLLAAVQVYAVPLNINLGAYSPALVVGDGEISLGGAAEASTLMETLATGAAQNAAANGAPAPAPAPGQEGEGTPAPAQAPEPEQAPAENGEEAAPEGAESPSAAIRNGLDPGAFPNTPNLKRNDLDADVSDVARKLKIRDFRSALNYAKEAMKDQPKVEMGTGEHGSGVGIIVGPGLNVPIDSAANGAKPAGEGAAAEKRSADTSEEPGKRGITLLAMMEI